MEKKGGIIVTREGLFIPARYFRQMADRLEVVLSPKEINIRSVAKDLPASRRPFAKRKTSGKRG